MSDQFNDKHLLWWVFRAIDTYDTSFDGLLDENLWKLIDAPDWVLPAIREKHAVFQS
jgi:hypothetical protein